jgi:hypothetical protein
MYKRRHLFTHIKFYVLNKCSGELTHMLQQAQAVVTGTANIVDMWRNQVMSAVVWTPALHKAIFLVLLKNKIIDWKINIRKSIAEVLEILGCYADLTNGLCADVSARPVGPIFRNQYIILLLHFGLWKWERHVVPELPIGIVLDRRPQIHSGESLKCPTEGSPFLHIFQKQVIR